MNKFSYVSVLFLAIESLFFSTGVIGDDAKKAERLETFREYYDFPSNVNGGRVVPYWMGDGNSFWFEKKSAEKTTIWMVDPVANTKERLPKAPVDLKEKTALSVRRREVLSPDGRWIAAHQSHNVYLQSTVDDRTVMLTTDGNADFEWAGTLVWSPDSRKLAALKYDLRRIAPEARERAHRVGNLTMLTSLFILDVKSKEQVQVDLGEPSFFEMQFLVWRQLELLFLRENRSRRGPAGHHRVQSDLMAANTSSGRARTIISESLTNLGDPPSFTFVDENSFIWESERDGWNHLYLYDFRAGLIRRLTNKAFPVVEAVKVDASRRWVYFTAHGDEQRPYRTQLYRVGLDGNGFKLLAEDTGQFFYSTWHNIHFAPSNDYFVVNRSTPSQPTVVELRKADGTFIMELSSVDQKHLRSLRWRPPEEFTAKAADGNTDLCGLLYKPYDFSPAASYPVIVNVYGASHISLMERHATFEPQWGTARHTQALAQLGYVVLMIDPRGTPGRSRRFQDVAFNDFHRHVILDHVAVLKQLAGERSYLDLNRVGILGASAGGTMTILALLTAPDVFHVGIALDFGFGPDPDAPSPLLKLAGKLQGKLMLVYGPHGKSTERLARAFIDSHRFFDVLPMPGADHGFSGPDGKYLNEAIRRYFDEHLK